MALINSCIEHPNPNGGPLNVESEILVVSSGIVPVPVNSIRVDVPFNGLGSENADISQTEPGDCRFKEPTVTSLPGCPGAIPLGPNDVIPPNAFVVIFTNGITVTADVDETDFSNICPLGATLYILQNECERTSGAFANGSTGGNPLRTIGVLSGCGLRAFTYNTGQISPEDGTYYLVGTNTSGNLDCDLPEIPETCPSIDTSFFLCDETGTMDPVPATDLEQLYPLTEVAVSFHSTPGAAETNENQITVYTPSGIMTDTLWARIIYSDNFCLVVSPLVITYQNGPATTNPPAAPLAGCDPDLLGVGLFDLTRLDAEIGGGVPVTYYTDAATTNEIPNPEAFTSAALTIFAVAGRDACRGGVVPVELVLDNSPLLDVSAEPTSCPGNIDGTITVTATGTGPFTYAWAGDSLPANPDLTDLPPGTYNVSVTNANGCTIDRDVVVPDGLPPVVNCRLQRGATGPGAMNAVIRLEMAEGRRPYRIDWVGAAAGTRTVNGAVAVLPGFGIGSYDFTITDADGCVSDACRVEVSEVVPITLECRVRNNSDGATILGSIITNIEDGVAPFLVQITDEGGVTTDFPDRPNGEILFDDLPVGQYTITVTGADGAVERCVRSIIAVPCPLTISDIRQFPVDCEGSDLVIVSIIGAGANGDISTTWSGPNNVEQFNGQQDAGPLPPGTYFVMINDEAGCSVDPGPIIVVDPGPPVYEVNTNGMSSICDPNGTIDVVLQGGGVEPYTVHLVDATNDTELASFTDRETGDIEAFFDLPGAPTGPNYYVYVTDQIGCSGDTPFVSIVGSAAAALELDPNNQLLFAPICGGDSTGLITLDASGGTGPYTYRWLDYPQRPRGRVLADGPTQTDLPAGDYAVEVSDVGSCLDTFTLVLPDGGRPTLTCGATVDAVGLVGGEVTVTPGAGAAAFTLTLTRNGVDSLIPNLPDGPSRIVGLPQGDYTGFVTDRDGCRSEPCTFSVNLVPCALAATAVIDSVDCSGAGQIALTVTGATAATSFNWDALGFPDAATVNPLAPGDFVVTISDANGCELDTSFTVFARDNAPTFAFTPPTPDRRCLDDEILIPVQFTGTAPFDLVYNIQSPGLPDQPGIDQFTTTTDTLRITRADLLGDSATLIFQTLADGACSQDFPDVSTQVFFTRPDTIRRNDVSCDPAPVMIAGRSFDPTNPTDTFLVNDGVGCGTVYAVDLTFLNESTDIPDTLEVFICAGTDYVEPTTGEVFNAARPEGELRYPRPGQCDSIVYLRLDIPPVTIGSYSEGGFCDGDTLFFGDRFFTIDNPTGLATLAGMGADGCDSLVTVTGGFRRVGELRLFGDFSICPGDSIELRFTYDGPGGIDAILEDSQGNRYDFPNARDTSRFEIFPTQSTAYRIVSTIAGPCPGEFAGRSSVVVNDLGLETDVLLDPSNFCVDTLGQVVATPSDGVEPYTYAWSNGPTDSLNRNLLGGTYAVTLTDGEGCQLIDSVSISDRVPLRVGLTANAPPCEGELGSLTVDSITGGGGFYEVSLDGTFFLPVENIGDFELRPGTGTAIFQDADDCSVEVDYFVPLAFDPRITLMEDTVLFLGDSVLLNPALSEDVVIDTAFWDIAEGLRTPDQLMTIAAPQSSTDYRFTLRTEGGCEFVRFVSVQVDERLPVYAPNVFSPNGDEVNDTYQLAFGPGVRDVTTFQIFNRWGNLMHDRLEGWDGNFNGQPAPPAVYAFQATIRMADGSGRFVKGDFVLMR
ncbi:MAG: T9SS type B sorting domain-containing protein [Bacteroidota bacterium]